MVLDLDELDHAQTELLTASCPLPVCSFGLWPAAADCQDEPLSPAAGVVAHVGYDTRFLAVGGGGIAGAVADRHPIIVAVRPVLAGEQAWRHARHHIIEAIRTDGTFLDVGCANGLLMESVAAWCAERALTIEPYGIDLAPGLVELARRRLRPLPLWADRIWLGNAIDWIPPHGQRFDYVHVLLDCVPPQRRADLIRHHLATTIQPGTGRLLVSNYTADPAAGSPTAAQALQSLGFACNGQTSGGKRPGRPPAPTAWINASPPPPAP
jgi:2-polyprenyl-3-methyl-5-hydroxy-6-metoxy-1,4-benzoquinol methylase